MEQMNPAARIAIPALVVVVGLVFLLTALLKPQFMWQTAKLQLGRRIMGEGGLMAFLACIGVALLCAGVVAALKLRSN